MRYIPFEERIARERNSGMLPFIDLVEPKTGEVGLLVVGEDKPRRGGRRPNPAEIDG